MKFLIDLVLRIADLAEAEGRLARRKAAQLAVVLMMTAAAISIAVVGALALALACFIALNEAMHPALALAIVAGGILLLAAILLLIARVTYQNRSGDDVSS